MNIVGVTACPTGIAHTYMAQKALEHECARRGFKFKFETQGSIGPENVLTQEEVDDADVVVLAVGVVIEGEQRWINKPVLEADVGRSIGHPDEIIDQALALLEAGGGIPKIPVNSRSKIKKGCDLHGHQ